MEIPNFEITERHIDNYIIYMEDREKSEKTLEKYRHDLYVLFAWLQGRTLDKKELIRWKEALIARYAPRTVNGLLAAANSFFRFMGWSEFRLRPLKLQQALFYDEDKELTKEEYFRLVKAAQKSGNERMALVLQTLCATGIRVSELRFITVEAVRKGRTEVHNKGKIRTIFLPVELCRILKRYIKSRKISAGAVFITRTGKCLDRSNIWKEMKGLCQQAEVEPGKVFPHNLRHLFARCFYALKKDICRLADFLGHSSIDTTRIYIAESGRNHARVIGELKLIIT